MLDTSTSQSHQVALPQLGASRPGTASSGSEGATLNLSDSFTSSNGAQPTDSVMLLRQMGQAFQRSQPQTGSGTLLAPRMFQPILPMNSNAGASITPSPLPQNGTLL